MLATTAMKIVRIVFFPLVLSWMDGRRNDDRFLYMTNRRVPAHHFFRPRRKHLSLRRSRLVQHPRECELVAGFDPVRHEPASADGIDHVRSGYAN
jgi:hypothetical protein